MSTAWSLTERLKTIRLFRHSMAEEASSLAQAVQRPEGEVWSSEIIPLLEACRFVETEARRILATREAKGSAGIAFRGLKTQIARRPFGKVLVIGPFNYPLYLPGSQCIQALAAGNEVIWKPGRNGRAVAELCIKRLIECGMPPEKLRVTDESAEAGVKEIAGGVDLIIFTGSVDVGKKIAALAANTLTPCIIEASGSDAMILTESADLNRAAKALWFGLTINSGQTCISPRRIFVPSHHKDDFISEVKIAAPEPESFPLPEHVIAAVKQVMDDALERGAKIITGNIHDERSMAATLLCPLGSEARLFQTDLFAPLAGIIPYHSEKELLDLEAECPFALGASIFGNSEDCQDLSSKIGAACVTINDCVAPTADPRASFGGNRMSGYGRTRGEAGLVACTTEQTIITRKGNFLPHLLPGALKKTGLFQALAKLSHQKRLTGRLKQIPRLIREARSNK